MSVTSSERIAPCTERIVRASSVCSLGVPSRPSGRQVDHEIPLRYHINGKQSSWKMVTQKLRQKGIDLVHNRFLILQGEVEQISLMPPKKKENGVEDGFLEYLEDIIGSTRLVPDIERLQTDFDLKDEEMNERRDKLKKAEDEVYTLFLQRFGGRSSTKILRASCVCRFYYRP